MLQYGKILNTDSGILKGGSMPEEYKAEPVTETGEPDNKEELRRAPDFNDSVPVRSTIAGLTPGLALLLLGLILLLSHYGLVRGEWWQYFLVGLGVIFLIGVWLQYIRPSGEKKDGLIRIIAGVALVIIGVVFLFVPTQWWPLIIIIAGIILIAQFLIRRRMRLTRLQRV
jgi:hypothetical protein